MQSKIEKTDPDKKYRRVLAASTLAGDSVRNSAGEDLGKLDEIMIDIPSGRVAYAVLSFGGVLRMGNKLFAVPWSALKVDEDKKCFVLNVDKTKLEKAPGFDKDKWPDMADTSDPQVVSAISGHLSLSKPGAFSSFVLSTFRTKHFLSSSTLSALHGTANSLFPMRRTPPKDSTASAPRPDGISIMISSSLPRSSPAALRTLSPASVLAARTRRYFLSGSVFLILFSIEMLLMLLERCTFEAYRVWRARRCRSLRSIGREDDLLGCIHP